MKTLKILENGEVLKELLAAQKKYDDSSQGESLYNQVILFQGDKFGDKFIELVYKTLKAWHMNRRGAKLADLKDFKKSILMHKDVFRGLDKYLLFDVNKNEALTQQLKKLFYALELTKTKTKLVTTAKTLHFFLPNLVVPMDGQNTLWFFGVGDRKNDCDSEAELFIEKQKEFSRFSAAIDLSQYIDNGWNKNIPKIIDNLIIEIKKF